MSGERTCGDRGKRDDIDAEDDQESYFRYMEENPMAGVIIDDDDNIDYDEDGNAIIPDKKVCGVCLLCRCARRNDLNTPSRRAPPIAPSCLSCNDLGPLAALTDAVH